MPAGTVTPIAAMQGAGFYNRNSTLQARTLTSALPLFEAAAASISVKGEEALVIVDYGASQGLNSMLPIGVAIDKLRARTAADRPIEVVHTDLPSNDFASLFSVLADGPSSYLLGRGDIYPAAIGRSYFGAILPPGRVDLGWSSNALHWMSRSPVNVPDHGWAVFSESQQARDAVDRVLDEDWRSFLLARSTELRAGGKLVCQFMGRGTARHGFEWMAGSFWQSLLDMHREGMLTPDELLRMTCPSAGRSIEQVQAPFEAGVFAGLSLNHLLVVQNPDPFWEAYVQDGDAVRLGRAWATAMRAANGPNFTAGLNSQRDPEAFLDALSDRLAARIAADPQRSESHMVIVGIEKH